MERDLGRTETWKSLVSNETRERLRQRPDEEPVMRQSWRHLLFLHFPIPPEDLDRHMPKGCQADVFPDPTGRPVAWVGIVLFRIERIRTLGLPALPGLSGFAEANVRTYVHRHGEDPSVLFLSLDGGPWITRALARAWYGVPYVAAQTSLTENSGEYRFQSQRRDGVSAQFGYRPCDLVSAPEPGSFEYFALERYQLLATSPQGLLRARVWHLPYQPYAVEYEGKTNLSESHGLLQRPFTSALYCDDVAAEFFAPELLHRA